MTNEAWPALPYDAWKDTCQTLHLWTQVVGKVALATAPRLNHSWAVALRLTSRGLTTGLLHQQARSFTIEFDFVDHRLVVAASDGDVRSLALEPQSVADFYAKTMGLLETMSLPVRIWPVAVELPSPIRLDEDTGHRSYDPTYAHRFWQVLTSVERAFSASRSGFVGKCSPVHFFWGSFDLAVTRFSGRPAPAREGPRFMREAYSHEVISHGFWPGSEAFPEPAFYAYAVPEPQGLREAAVRPEGARYDTGMGEFLLPYEKVRESPSPDLAVGEFVESTYEAAAALAGWDRSLLEDTNARGR
jgi:hypothetical protein